jgi:hypothetical protein
VDQWRVDLINQEEMSRSRLWWIQATWARRISTAEPLIDDQLQTTCVHCVERFVSILLSALLQLLLSLHTLTAPGYLLILVQFSSRTTA